MKQTIEVIIVTYNGREVLGACLDSIRGSETHDLVLQTYVVDNKSTDGSVEWIRENYPEVSLIQSQTNAGFSAANNLALAKTRSEFVLILNPDTVLTPDVLPHLLGVAQKDLEIGMIGCRLEQLDGSFDHAAKRGFPTYRDALKYFTARRDRDGPSHYLASHIGERSIGAVDALNGAFMLVRSEALRNVGLFDERYWMYGEDLDWCRRFRDAGWKVVYDGRVTAIHMKSGLTGRVRSFKLNWHFHKSMAMFYRDYEAGKNPALDVTIYTAIALRMAWFSLKYVHFRLSSWLRTLTQKRG